MLSVAILVLLVAYLVGAIPFGWMIARAKGIDIFAAGSGNIGATNVGRILGRKFGILVFVLDFAKGAIPVAVAGALPTEVQRAFDYPQVLQVGCAIAAFLGHMFPIFLKFRGGKGVATGAGTVFVLVPGPMLLATLAWLAVTSVTRTVSLGSLAAVSMLCVARCGSVVPWATEHVAVTCFVIGGSTLLVVKHRANIRRLFAGTENRLEDKPMFGTLARTIHVLALGLWFGSAVMFNFIAAPAIFASFKEVVENAPSDRTAYQPLAPNANDEQRKQLASALAGSAVGPIFPTFFMLQGLCAFFALVPALGWWKAGKVHRRRVVVIAVATLTVALGWPISNKVSALRLERFNPELAESARLAFGQWHMVSLGLSLLTAVFAGLALAYASQMPVAGEKS